MPFSVRNLKSTALGAVVAAFVAVPSQAVTVDFESMPFGGTITGEQLGVSSIGSGNCDQLSIGSSSAAGAALCGNNLNNGANATETFVISDVNFNTVRSIHFSLGAESGNDRFELPNTSGADFFRVVANGTQVVNFIADASNRRRLTSALGTTLANGNFVDFTLTGALLSGLGTGDLEFQMRTTGGSEQIGLDSISIKNVPLPSSSIAFLGGLGLMAGARLLRNRRA
ncbi:MAG: hypothetical protein AAF607_17240 [Pseudomonadota bacterium]